MCSLLPICMETSIGFLRNFVFDCNKFAPLEGENGTSCGRLAVHITAMIQYFSLGGFFLGLTAAISLRVFILKSVTARAHSAFGDVKIPAIYRTEKGFADNYFKMIHVSASLFLGLTWLAIHGMVRCNGDDAPNPGCEYLISPGNTTLSCPGGMDIPVNFDVTKIRKGVHEIVIAAGNGNVLRSDAPPLPANLTALRKISFSGFTNEHDSRIAIKRFLDNVKDHITELRIDNSKVGFLEDGFLHGFTQLTTLDLSGCDISSIGLEAFARTAIDVATPSMIVDLAGNRIESIDWAVLEPIALTSLSLQLGSQTPGLKLINCSANYIFNRPVGSVSFAGNRLESLPQCVIDSLNYDASSTLNVDYNPFCPTDELCGCPAMQPFLRFACKDFRVNPVSNFKCGPASNQRSWTASQLPPSAPCNSGNGVQRLLYTSWGIVVSAALMLFARSRRF